MSYCPKCGNKVDETMTFCPRCGAALKGAPNGQAPPPAQPYTMQEKGEKREKSQYGFVGYLMGGLILITIGVFFLLDLTSNFLSSGQDLAVMLFIIGIIIIMGAVYVAMVARRRFPETKTR